MHFKMKENFFQKAFSSNDSKERNRKKPSIKTERNGKLLRKFHNYYYYSFDVDILQSFNPEGPFL